MDILLYARPLPYRPIYLDDRGELFAIVDEIDYPWAVQWKWRVTFSKDRGRSWHKRKAYATRSARIGGREGRNVTLYLHKEILKRTGQMPPTTAHIIGDHLSGESLDCRRGNLRWATPQQNYENYNGYAAKQIRMAIVFNAPERLLTQERKYKR